MYIGIWWWRRRAYWASIDDDESIFHTVRSVGVGERRVRRGTAAEASCEDPVRWSVSICSRWAVMGAMGSEGSACHKVQLYTICRRALLCSALLGRHSMLQAFSQNQKSWSRRRSRREVQICALHPRNIYVPLNWSDQPFVRSRLWHITTCTYSLFTLYSHQPHP